MSILFEPLKLGHLELANRVIIAPMCQYSADTDGSATAWHTVHLGQLAMSGAGMLTLEATAVSARGRITAHDLGLYSDANEAAMIELVRTLRGISPIPIALQLAHAGRKGSSAQPWKGGHQLAPNAPEGWTAEAPSALPHADGESPPEALDDAGLRRVRDDFVATALRAVRCGFSGLEIHMAHGYLLHQFLSPLANHRSDRYGGSLENRMRFPLEVFRAVREAVPASIPVWARLSAVDWVEGGWTLDESIALSLELQREGAAAIHVSSGGVSPKQSIKLGPGYQVPFAKRIREETGLVTIAVGLITSAAQAETILHDGAADAVALARAMLYDPRWVWHAAAEFGATVTAPPQYWRSTPREVKNLFSNAAFGQR